MVLEKKVFRRSSESAESNALDIYIYDALRDLVPFVQFKKREKHPWRSVKVLKPATLLT